MQKSLEQNIDQCTKLKADYDDFIPLAKTDVEEYLAAFKAGGSDIDVYETEVERLYKVWISNNLSYCIYCEWSSLTKL